VPKFGVQGLAFLDKKDEPIGTMMDVPQIKSRYYCSTGLSMANRSLENPALRLYTSSQSKGTPRKLVSKDPLPNPLACQKREFKSRDYFVKDDISRIWIPSTDRWR